MNFNELFFGSHSTTLQVLVYAALILTLWMTEVIILTPTAREKWRHTSNNVLFIITGLPIQLLMSILVLMVSSWAVTYHFGLLNLLPHADSIFVKFIVGFFLLDFCEYLYHVIMHKVKALWKFHIVHHTDQQLDVSTTVREHPGETFIRMCFLTIWVFALGASFELLLIRQTLQTIANITSHTCFRFPNKVEKWVGMVFVTPNIHQVHHHYQLPYTDCNYGDILSIWDRLFGTYNKLELGDTLFGIDTHMDKKLSNNFINVLKIPFKFRSR
jgi:sterol desaturase/sphingolipid hydroxylase (fatty acid hydroxylase superfamily)